MAIGNRIKEQRLEKNMTQVDLSKELGVSRQTISSWENDRSFPDIESIMKMAQIYNLSMDELLLCDSKQGAKEKGQDKFLLKTNLKRNILFLFLLFLCILVSLDSIVFIMVIIFILILKYTVSDFFQLNIER